MTANSSKPVALVSSNVRLFRSFFDQELRDRLAKAITPKRSAAATITPAFRSSLRDSRILITTWDSPSFFPEELLQWAPSLRMIAHCGGSVKTRFARSLFDRLVITNAPQPMARHVAELAVAFLLYLARDVDRYRALLRRSSNAIYEQLHSSGGGEQTILDSEIGMIGYGRIGRAIRELLLPFGVRLLVHDPYVDSATAPAQVRFAVLDEVLSASRYLIVAAGLTPETTGMLNRKRLLLLPKGAAIVNVARGAIIDIEALTPLVLRGRLRCALDVTDPLEPLPIRHPLRSSDYAIVTPHVGAISRSVRQEIALSVISGIQQFLAGRAVENRVTAEMLDRMT